MIITAIENKEIIGCVALSEDRTVKAIGFKKGDTLSIYTLPSY
jgi:hypothetical protein